MKAGRQDAAAEQAGVPPAVVYGHAGNGHPHQNYIARDGDELARILDELKTERLIRPDAPTPKSGKSS